MKKLFFYITNILISLHTFGQGSWLTIEILTDNYPLETSWLLEDENGNVIDQISTGDLVCANTYYNWDIYIDDNICYQFTILDSYGDGICCSQGNGSYTISYNNIISIHYLTSYRINKFNINLIFF